MGQLIIEHRCTIPPGRLVKTGGALTNSRSCCCCNRVCCKLCSNISPCDIEVTISGFADGVCSECNEEMDGTFFMPASNRLLVGCEWDYVLAASTCGYEYLEAVITKSLGEYSLEVAWVDLLGTTRSSFTKYYGTSAPDCKAWNATDVPWSGNTGFPFCDGSSATCSITALI